MVAHIIQKAIVFLATDVASDPHITIITPTISTIVLSAILGIAQTRLKLAREIHQATTSVAVVLAVVVHMEEAASEEEALMAAASADTDKQKTLLK